MLELGKNGARNPGGPGEIDLLDPLGQAPILDETTKFHREHGCTLNYPVFTIVNNRKRVNQSGWTSISSAIATALIGKGAGDEVDVSTSGEMKKYEILDVRYE